MNVANVPALQITSLSKSYGDTDALNDVSLTIEQGEIFGLLGPNGSGKTTLINCVAQLADRDTGSISVMGLDVDADYNEVKKRVGLSLQEPNADPYFSIRRALIYQAGYFGISRDTAEQRVDSLLRQFDLYDKRSNTFRELSGGMQRKISLIKALLHEPDVLILDEPTAALDVEARVELWEHVRSVNDDGVTVLLTTHYIEEAEEMCERICFLRDGEVLRVSRTEDIMDELSRNCITILFNDDIPVLPESFPDHTVDEGRGAVEITVSRGEQSKRLREALEVLDDNGIDYRNFNIQEDRLEQIFRRMMQDE
jgi:ABC-2 type transport system ATP-binding protein